MAVHTGNKAVARTIAQIDEKAWVGIEYTPGAEAQVAGCDYKGRRLIVRRTRLLGPQATLWPDWRHFAFLTDLDGEPVELDAFHRQHAVVELAIRELKEGSGLAHVPSGHFSANAAWLACAVLAHNLVRWTAALGNITPDDQLVVTRTVRTRVLAVPGRLVNRAGTPTCGVLDGGRGPSHSSSRSLLCEHYPRSPSNRASRGRRTADDHPALTIEP
jgi:hypothetical protein